MSLSLRKALWSRGRKRPHTPGSFGALAVLVMALGAGCGAEGYTPTCNDNVNENGIGLDAEGCERYGQCVMDDKGNVCAKSDPCPGAKVHKAADCCVDADGEPLTGNPLKACLYGYGEYDVNKPSDGS